MIHSIGMSSRSHVIKSLSPSLNHEQNFGFLTLFYCLGRIFIPWQNAKAIPALPSKAQKVIMFIPKCMSRNLPASISTSTQTAGG
jgi:hypothetical protein